MEYSKEQVDFLQKALHEMYEDNLEFLQIYNKKTYDKIIDLDDKINAGKYDTRYELEFINNSFNIYDSIKKEFLYEKNLDDYTIDVLKELDYSNKGSLTNLINDVYTEDNVGELRMFNNDIQTKSYKQLVRDIGNFRELFHNPKITRNTNFKYISSFVFFGTLLGKHLYPIKQKFKSKSHLIVEPNIEIFRLSLFITEYKLLSQESKIFFSIGQNDYEMVKEIEPFILYDSFESYIYKYYSTSYHDKQLFNNFTLSLQNTTPFAFDYYRQMHYVKESISRINKYPVLVENKKTSDIQDLPILLLSPGPSLRKNFKWLKKNKDKFITMAFGATVKALHEAGIIPDIITSVDASTLIMKQFPSECKKTYQNSIALLSTDSHEDMFTLFKKENIFIFEANFKLKEKGLRESPALTVGDNSLHILLSMGFKNIFMLGTDLFVDIDTGTSYDKSHESSKSKHNVHYLKKNIKKISEEIDVADNYIKIDSNLGNKTLYANQFFYKIIESYSVISQSHKKNYAFDVFNLSDGARIPNIKSLDPRNIELPNLKEKKNKKFLNNFFKIKSKKKFSKSEKNKMKLEIEFIKELITSIKFIKNSSLIDSKEFYDLRKEYAMKIVKYKSYSSITKSLLSTHIKVIDSYINFIFNDENFTYSKIELLKIKIQWCKQTNLILEKYKKILKKTQV